MGNAGINGLGTSIIVLLVLYAIVSIPETAVKFYDEMTRVEATDDNIKEFKINSDNCKLAKWENLKQHLFYLQKPKSLEDLNQNNFYLTNDSNKYFSDGLYYKRTFYLVDDISSKKQFLEKVGFGSICQFDVDVKNRSTKQQRKIEDIKYEFDKKVKDVTVAEADVFLNNLEKIEKAIGNNEFLIKTFKLKLKDLDFSNDQKVEELLTLVNVLKKDK